MAIPEDQLERWSHQGSIQQSSGTYQTIRDVLQEVDSGYYDKEFKVFLQGSYGNDTNIYAESDVDVVIRLDTIYHRDIEALSDGEKQAYEAYKSPPTCRFDDFKSAVASHLRKQFGNDSVSVGKKAIKIAGYQNRRDADVVVCCQYRRFKSFSVEKTDDYVRGIWLPTPSGNIINYPEKHAEYLTSKHQASGNMLKPMVRILKNMRSRMVENGDLKDGVAPSYYIEGMFYNVPAEKYDSTSYGNTFCNGINWLLKEAEKKKLVCANWQYWLIGDTNVQWPEANYDAFISAVCKLWND